MNSKHTLGCAHCVIWENQTKGELMKFVVVVAFCMLQVGCAALQAVLYAPNADEEKWIAKVDADADAIAQKPPISNWLTGNSEAKKIADYWAGGGPAVKTEGDRPKRLAFEDSLGNPETLLG